MPQNDIQWLFFLWFCIGSLGGWLILGILALEAWKSFKKVRPR